MADKTAAKGRAKGTGQIFKKGNRFYLQIRSKGERKTFLLRNADDSYCTTKAQAEEAAKRINKKTLELDTLENVVDTMAGIRQLKREATFGFDDIWPSFLKSANRPDANENHLREQKRELDRFVAWVCEQERKPNVDTEQSKKKGRSKPLADEAQTQKITSPAEITPELANEYMGIIGKNVSNRTFNVYLGYLRLIFSLTYAMAGLRSNPFEGINRRTEITASRSDFTEQQIAQIFAGFSKGFFEEVKQEGFDGHGGRCVRIIQHEFKPLFKDEMEVLLKLCCFTGCDGQSGCLMKWDGVNMDMNTISYIREKTIKATGGKVITLPIHPVLRDALEKAQSWREADCPYILPHVAERYKRNHWGVQKDVQKIIHCALKVDVTNRESVGKRAMPANRYSLHSFRHSFVSIAVKSGVPLDVVSEIVGHGNPLMTEHYRHIHDDSKQAAIAALPDMGADVDTKPKDITTDSLRLQIATFVNNAGLPDLQAVWHFIEELQKSRPKQLVEHAQHQAVEE